MTVNNQIRCVDLAGTVTPQVIDGRLVLYHMESDTAYLIDMEATHRIKYELMERLRGMEAIFSPAGSYVRRERRPCAT